jgi:hypothetical protein
MASAAAWHFVVSAKILILVSQGYEIKADHFEFGSYDPEKAITKEALYPRWRGVRCNTASN